MFNFNDSPHSEALDQRISELLEELDALTGSAEDYTTTANNLAKLMELKNQALKTGNESTKIQNDRIKIENDAVHEDRKINIDCDKVRLDKEKFVAEQEKLRSWKPSPDAVVGAAASVVGILFVLHFEKLGVVTSKALGFVGKLK